MKFGYTSDRQSVEHHPFFPEQGRKLSKIILFNDKGH